MDKMKVQTKNLRFIRVLFLIGIVVSLFFFNSLVPHEDKGIITGAITAQNKTPTQLSILISLSALLAILVVIILVIILFIRDEKLLRHFFH